MMDACRPVRAVIDYFEERDIAIGRPFPPIDTYVRISFGQPHEMTAFWQVWDALAKSHASGGG